MADKRRDPLDGQLYTFEELSSFYRGKYKKKQIADYWETCAPVEGAKTAAKAKPKATPKGKPKAKAADAATKPTWAKAPIRKAAPAEDVLKRIQACKVIPVIKVDSAAHAAPLAQALLAGGVDVVELTFRTTCAPEAIRRVVEEVKEVCVGAGTVLEPAQVDVAVAGGADFVISPGFSEKVWRRCKQLGVLYLPGVVTPTEVMMAASHGLKALKFFPASNYGGVGTLKSFSAVFQDIQFMPTGGVTEANVADFVGLPNVMAAGGSWFVADAAIKSAAESGSWTSITDGARTARAAAGFA